MYIKTKRLTLRPWQPQDNGPFAALNQDDMVMEFFPKKLTKEESDNLIETLKEHYQKHDFGLMAAELNDNQEFIGFIGLNIPTFKTNFTPCVEIGWRLAKKYWGQGFAPEGAAAVLEYAFQELNLQEIVAFTTTKNTKSRRVMEKISMKHDAARDFLHPNLPSNHAIAPHVVYFTNKELYAKK